jgi:spore coat protein A, manganese oxidase
MKKRDKGGCSRRDFIKYSASAAALASLQWKSMLQAAKVPVTGPYGTSSPPLTKFVDPLRIIGVDIPAAVSDGTSSLGAVHYSIEAKEFTDVLHSDFLNPAKTGAYMGAGFPGTKLWGYGQAGPGFKHLGGAIIANRGQAVQVTFSNNLPPIPIIPQDWTVIPAGNLTGANRMAVHCHGGRVPWTSDGGPFDWWDPNGNRGLSFLNNQTLLGGPGLPNQAEYYYPNQESARLLWYHDHAFGTTRTNAYSGLATGYIIVDAAAENAFAGLNPGLPPVGSAVYLVFQDKIFFGPGGPPAGYAANAGPGDLFYADTYNTALFGPQGIPSFGGLALPLPTPSCVPEFFGDTILVNGAAYPRMTVEAKPYRFRILNACNARFLNPRLVGTAGQTFPNNAEPDTTTLGPSFLQLGTEGGYLPQATPVAGKGLPQLLLAPAERADFVIDFSKVKPGKEFILYNDAPGPFPGGMTVVDVYPKNPKTPWSTPGFGPNTRTLMKFTVVAPAATPTPLPVTVNMAVPGLSEPLLINQTPGVPTPTPAQGSMIAGPMGTFPVANVRMLTLNEGFDEYGRLQQFIGTNLATGVTPGFYGKKLLDPPTEIAAAGSVEVWQIANLTADTHPIHFHLVNVQILSRQGINKTGTGATYLPNYTGGPVAPDLNELGYKETVRMNPGEVITVIMKFDLPTGLPFTVPPSPRTGNHEYVYHCHILEHEEHDMMRPLVVI